MEPEKGDKDTWPFEPSVINTWSEPPTIFSTKKTSAEASDVEGRMKPDASVAIDRMLTIVWADLVSMRFVGRKSLTMDDPGSWGA